MRKLCHKRLILKGIGPTSLTLRAQGIFSLETKSKMVLLNVHVANEVLQMKIPNSK